MLKERVCIVTGAARGIGRQFALHFAGLGARVVAADRLSCDATIQQIREASGEAIPATGDVTSAGDAAAIVAAAVDEFGRIDVLVNNAALYGGIAIRGFEDIPEAEWDRVMSVNVKSVWQMCRAVSAPMRAQGGGRIINVASNVIFMGKPGFLHYVASQGRRLGVDGSSLPGIRWLGRDGERAGSGLHYHRGDEIDGGCGDRERAGSRYHAIPKRQAADRTVRPCRHGGISRV